MVRPATNADFSAVAAIYNESIRARDCTMDLTERSADYFEALVLGMSDREGLLVLDEEGVVAWGVLKQYSDREGYARACETSVYVQRQDAGGRRGFGSDLQEALVALARGNGYQHIVVKIWAGNDISVRMHEKFGFEKVGVQREIGYVDGERVDVLIMQLVL